MKQSAQRLDGVGLCGRLVVTIALDACESQGDSTRIAGRVLDAVDGDLYHGYRRVREAFESTSSLSGRQYLQIVVAIQDSEYIAKGSTMDAVMKPESPSGVMGWCSVAPEHSSCSTHRHPLR